MSNVDKIKEFMHKYGVSKDEVWLVPGGKNYAISHAAIERIAFQHNINFLLPTIIEADSANKIATVLVTGQLGEDLEQWSIGEASPANNKNAYPFAMAEKRAKDRVVLKLLNIHGLLYSEAEADAFTEKTLSLKTTKEPIHVKPEEPAKTKEQEREPSQTEAFNTLKKMLEGAPTIAALNALMDSANWKTTIELVHGEDRPQLRKAFAERRTTLSYKEPT